MLRKHLFLLARTVDEGGIDLEYFQNIKKRIRKTLHFPNPLLFNYTGKTLWISLILVGLSNPRTHHMLMAYLKLNHLHGFQLHDSQLFE